MSYRSMFLISLSAVLVLGGVVVWLVGVDRFITFPEEDEVAFRRGATTNSVANDGLLVTDGDRLFVVGLANRQIYTMNHNISGVDHIELDYSGLSRIPLAPLGNEDTFARTPLIGNLQVVENWLYFSLLNSEITGGGVYRKILDDNSIERIANTNSVDTMVVLEDWIYITVRRGFFENNIPFHAKRLYRISRSGDIQERLVDHFVTYVSISEDGWIYYVRETNEAIYKIRLDGGESTLVSNTNRALSLLYYDGWLYYRHPSNDESRTHYLSKVRYDGTENVFLAKIGNDYLTFMSSYLVTDTHVYFVTYRRLYRIRLDNQSRYFLGEIYQNEFLRQYQESMGFDDTIRIAKVNDTLYVMYSPFGGRAASAHLFEFEFHYIKRNVEDVEIIFLWQQWK